MKQVLSVILCIGMLLSLGACNPDGGTASGETASATAETAPVSLATVPSPGDTLSGESVLPAPQVGEYAESVFLANVPNQKSVLLLSVRSDGTVDYIFSEEPLAGTVFHGMEALGETELRYYTITPEGEATCQPLDWVPQLDEALAAGLENTGDGNVSWSLKFSACEGNILILASLGGGGRSLNAVVYRVTDGQLAQVPIPATAELEGETVSISLNGSGTILAVRDGFFLNAFDNLKCFLYSFTYDGVPLARQYLDGENLLSLDAAGASAAWFETGDRNSLKKMNGLELSPMEAYPLTSGQTLCTAAAPDGSAAYLLRTTGTRSKIWLSKVSQDLGETIVGGNQLYTFEDWSCVPSCLAAANDGTFYTWTQGSGDGAGQGVLRQYRYNPQGAMEPELRTVYSLERNPTVQTAVSLWNRTHQDIIFQYTVGMEELQDTSLTKEDAIVRLNTRLVNGEGPDVLILDGLPVDSIVDKGFLSPLPDLDVTGVYPKLLERFTVDGSLYAVPAKMLPLLVGRKTEGTEPVDSLEGFADSVESATKPLDLRYKSTTNDCYTLAVYYIDYADHVFDLWYPAWWDAIWEGGSFHPEVYEALLTGTGRLVKHYSLETIDQVKDQDPSFAQLWDAEQAAGGDMTPLINGTDNCVSSTGAYPYCFAATSYVGLLNYLPPASETGSSDPIPCEIVGIPGPDGTGAAIPTCIAGVRDGGDREAGLAFLQLLLSDTLQLSIPGKTGGIFESDGYPVKWSCTPALLDATAAQIAVITGEELRPFQIENDFEAALSALRPVIPDAVLDGAAREAALRYYEGNLTLQEAVDQVAEETAIYLAEQRQ